MLFNSRVWAYKPKSKVTRFECSETTAMRVLKLAERDQTKVLSYFLTTAVMTFMLLCTCVQMCCESNHSTKYMGVLFVMH